MMQTIEKTAPRHGGTLPRAPYLIKGGGGGGHIRGLDPSVTRADPGGFCRA